MNSDASPFTADFWVNISSLDQLRKWREEFNISSHTEMALRSSVYNKQSYKAFQVVKCKFGPKSNKNQKYENKSGKKRKREDYRTSCPSQMVCKLYNQGHFGDFFLKVSLHFDHNHAIVCADALRHRKPLQEVKEKFLELFHAGHTAFTALTTHKMDLLKEYGDEFYKKCGDGAYLPDRYRVYYWYKNEFIKSYGDSSDADMFHRLTEQAKNFNDAHGEKCVHVEKFKKEIIVVIITPLMKRNHKIAEAGDIVGIDSGRGYDRHNTAIWHITTRCFTTTVPLGLILTNSESVDVLTKALQIYKDMLPEDCFGGRGRELGPQVIIRDGSDTEGTSIQVVWPLVIQLLCIFHVLQALWRWMFASENGIRLSDRPHMLCLFRDILYDTTSDLEKSIKKMFQDKIVKKYKNYISHIKLEYMPTIKLWALQHRVNLPVHGMLTNNVTESSIKQSKEHVFQRIKAFNIPQTLDFILTRYEKMYEIKMCIFASNRSAGFHKGGYIHDPKKGPDASKITRIDEKMAIFKVPSEFTKNKFYIVNLDLGVCQCESGKWGATCKHQNVAAYVSKSASTNVIPVNNPQMRQKMYTLATGNTSINKDWFRQLKPTSLPEPETVVEPAARGDLLQQFRQTLTPESEVRSNDGPFPPEEMNLEFNDNTESGDQPSDVIDSPEKSNEELDMLIQSIADDLKIQHRNNPEMKPAIRKFARTYKEILKFPIAKQSALHNFGSEFDTKPKLKGSGRIKTTTKGRQKRVAMPAGYKPRGSANRDEVRPQYGLLPRKPPKEKEHRLGKLVKENKSGAKRHSQAPVSTPKADI